MRKHFAAFTLLFGLLAPLALAQGALPPVWVTAEQFNQWSLQSQAANTYTFSGSNCQSFAVTNGYTPPYFVFGPTATAYPLLIQDASPTLSEIVTPSATFQTNPCGFTASTANSHTSFVVKSGTGGLQDAVGTLKNANSNHPANVLIDSNFYSIAAGLPGNKTVAGLIAALTNGSTGVQLVDTTASPWQVYVWNGSNYVASFAPATFPNLNVTSFTGLSAPTALSTAAATNGLITTAATGGTVAAATYRLAATYVDAAGGETLISTDSASAATIATSGSTSTISVTSPAAATGAVGWRLYMSAASGSAGSEILYTPTCSSTNYALQPVLVPATVCPIGASATITAVVTGTATVPAIANAYPRTSGTSLSFPPFVAAGTVASTNIATLGVVNFPAGWLNTLGRSFQVCGNGYATTNGTGGTITVAHTLASVPGVTSITPFTAVSASIGASAIQVPIDFCVTYTTAATGATGTLEAHGVVHYGLAGTAVDSPAMDIIFAVSSTVDLTKQNQLAVTVKPTTAGLTAAQLRQLTITPLN